MKGSLAAPSSQTGRLPRLAGTEHPTRRAQGAPLASLRTVLALLASVTCVASGCSLFHQRGPVSDSVASCRELSQEGLSAMHRGDLNAAEAMLRRATDTCPTDIDARIYYGETLWQRGEHQAARAQLQQALYVAPNDARLHLRVAQISLAMSDTTTAGREVAEALELDPTLTEAWVLRGRLMHGAGRMHEALGDYHRALKYDPRQSDALLLVAEWHREMGQPWRALTALHELSDLYPPGSEPQYVLYLTGRAYSATGRYEEAAQSFQAALGRGEASAEICFRLGEAQWMAGASGTAAESARQALVLTPEHQPSRELLERIELARRAGQTASR